MEAFVTANQFVAKAKARHESAFLEPENGAERAQEENTFDHSKIDDPFVKDGVGGVHHLRAQWALRFTHGTVSIARSRCDFLFGSFMYVSMSREYVLLWMFLTAIWKP